MLGSGAIVGTARILLGIDDSEIPSGIAHAGQQVERGASGIRTQLSKLEEAQIRTRRAQEGYTAAVAKFPAESRQVENALLRLSAAQRHESEAIQSSSAHWSLFGRHVREGERELGRGLRGAVAGSGVFQGLGRQVAFASGAFLGGAGFIEVTKHAVGQGVELQHQLERNQVLFGSNGRAIDAWSHTTAMALGLSRLETLKFTNDVGQMLRGLEVAPAKAAGMSQTLVKLAANMAALKGVPVESAMMAIERGLAGSSRALKLYGVSLDSAALKAEALRLGLVKGKVDLGQVADAQTKIAIAQAKLTDAQTKYGASSTQAAQATVALHTAQDKLAQLMAGKVPAALTANQKALAAYHLILGQTTTAHDFFAKHADSVTIKEKQLHAQLQNLTTELGVALLPAVNKLLGQLLKWIDHAQKTGEIQKDLNKAVHLGTDAVHGIKEGLALLRPVVEGVDDVTGSFKHTLVLLIGLKMAFIVKGWVGALGKLIGVAGAAEGSGLLGANAAARLLLGNLETLKALAVNPITVEILFGLLPTKLRDQIAQQLVGEPGPPGSGLTGNAKFVGKGFTGKVPSGANNAGYVYKRPAPGIVGPFSDGSYWAVDGMGTLTHPVARPPVGTRVQDPGTGAVDTVRAETQVPGNPKAGRQGGTAFAVVTKAKQLGVGSGGVYRTGGGHSGVARPGSVFDCSGYVYQVFTQSGFSGFPGTSETQWSTDRGGNWVSQRISVGDARPGDVVFMVGVGYASPGHVGIVTDGSGSSARVMQYYSTGMPADTVELGSIGDLVGIKRFYLVKKGGATSGGATAGAATAPAGGGGGSRQHLHVGHGAKPAKIPLIPPSLQLGLSKAEVTKQTGDDVAALRAILHYLSVRIAHEHDVNLKIKLLAAEKKAQAELNRILAQRTRDAHAAAKAVADEQAKERIAAAKNMVGGLKAGAQALGLNAPWQIENATSDADAVARATDRLAIAQARLVAAKKRYADNTVQVATAQLAVTSAQGALDAAQQKQKADRDAGVTGSGPTIVGSMRIAYDPKTHKYKLVEVKPDVDALKAYRDKTLIPALNKLQQEIRALEQRIKALGRHPKMNAAILGRLRATLAALKADRTELISLINDVTATVKQISDALALQPDTGQEQTTDTTPPLDASGSNLPGGAGAAAGSSGLTQADVNALAQQNLLGYLAALYQLPRSFASNVIAAAFAGQLGATPNERDSRGRGPITVHAFFPTAPTDPHLFTKALEFELRSLVA